MRQVVSFCSVIIVGVAAGVGLRMYGRGSPAPTPRYQVTNDGPTYEGRLIPAAGLSVTPDSKDNGDVNKAIKDLKGLYAAIDQYRRVHKELPRALIARGQKSFLGAVEVDKELLTNPDSALFDTKREALHCYVEAFRTNRPNGKARPAFPAKGERDVWISTDIYTRRNQVVLQSGVQKFHLKGVFVVLFSDGKIEKIPFGDAILSPKGKSEWVWTFPGQTGLPKGSVKYRDFVKSGPRATYTFEK